jgi:hypothetical protein
MNGTVDSGRLFSDVLDDVDLAASGPADVVGVVPIKKPAIVPGGWVL